MAKRLTLNQLAAKKYDIIKGIPPEYAVLLGEPETSFDLIAYGGSGNGKSNFIAGLIGMLLTCLPDARCEYVAFEEKHGKSIRDTMIKRAHLDDVVGNRLVIADRYGYEELIEAMAKRRSAKIWVFDSAQASGYTAKQFERLRDKFIRKNGKIIIYVSWSQGKKPDGDLGKALEYYADVKIFVDRLIAIPKPGRFSGLTPFIIYEPIAKLKWGEDFNKIKRQITAAIKEYKKQHDAKQNADHDGQATGGRPLLHSERPEESSPASDPKGCQENQLPDLPLLGA